MSNQKEPFGFKYQLIFSFIGLSIGFFIGVLINNGDSIAIGAILGFIIGEIFGIVFDQT